MYICVWWSRFSLGSTVPLGMHAFYSNLYVHLQFIESFFYSCVSIIRLVYCLTCLKKLSYNAVTIKKNNGKLRINERKCLHQSNVLKPLYFNLHFYDPKIYRFSNFRTFQQFFTRSPILTVYICSLQFICSF